ncbi:uncharacterized protein LOC113227803 isoform X2 [Hyposmocoma kahamanoa]|nr:uncharacterized protein LOC113227803 isoform X2 [Hyposmocoma kahamanoa]
MQFVMIMNYDKLPVLLTKQQAHVETILKPLVDEIIDADPDDDDDDAAFKRLYRKICIYISMASGLGAPSVVVNLKEAMAALESVYDFEELYLFVTLPRSDKAEKLQQLLELVSGVRLYNRDCKLGGEMIPDLPMDLVDASKASLATLSNSLMGVMQRVNTLTTAIDDRIVIEDETGNIIVSIPKDSDLTEDNYKQIFELLIFNRQYEMYTRRLLFDVEVLVHESINLQSEVKQVLDNIQATCRFKSAVPIASVFPLFTRLWEVWESMQNTMFLVSTITRLTNILGSIQDHMRIPLNIVDAMLQGKKIIGDEERLSSISSAEETSIVNLRAITTIKSESLLTVVHMAKHVQYLGFCVVCLCQGALIPCNLKLGMMKHNGNAYGFCSYKMAARFAKDPQRYINEVLNFARNNPQIIILLNLRHDVESVREIDELVVRSAPKVKNFDKNIQTEVHLYEKNIDRNYIWDLWEYKKRACKWADVTNCKTHSTQTNHSHMRSEHHCQTVEPRDKCHQTNREVGVMTNMCNFFYWGLRGQRGYGQHSLDLEQPHLAKKLKPLLVEECSWPCFGELADLKSSSYKGSDDGQPFFYPGSFKKEDMSKLAVAPRKRRGHAIDRTEESINTTKTVVIAHANFNMQYTPPGKTSAPNCATPGSKLKSVSTTHEPNECPHVSTGTLLESFDTRDTSIYSSNAISRTYSSSAAQAAFSKPCLATGTAQALITKLNSSAGTVQESVGTLHTLTGRPNEFVIKSHVASSTEQASFTKSHASVDTALIPTSELHLSPTNKSYVSATAAPAVIARSHLSPSTAQPSVAKSLLSAATAPAAISKSHVSAGTVQAPTTKSHLSPSSAQASVAKSHVSVATAPAAKSKSDLSVSIAQASIAKPHISATTAPAGIAQSHLTPSTAQLSASKSHVSAVIAPAATSKSHLSPSTTQASLFKSHVSATTAPAAINKSHVSSETAQTSMDILNSSTGTSKVAKLHSSAGTDRGSMDTWHTSTDSSHAYTVTTLYVPVDSSPTSAGMLTLTATPNVPNVMAQHLRPPAQHISDASNSI